MTIGNGINSEFLTDVARGVYPGKSLLVAFGEKITIGADSGLIWPDGAFNINPSTQVSIDITSTSAQDAVGGTGINSVEVHYIDANWNETLEVITLTGLTPKTMVATDVRFIQCVHIVVVGSGRAAAGNITFQASGGGAVYSYIALGETRCTSSARMVPAGKRLMVYSAVAGAVSGTAAAQAKIRLSATQIYQHQFIDPIIFIPYASLGFQDGSYGQNFSIPITLPEKNVFAMTFTTDKAATVTGSWFGILEDA